MDNALTRLEQLIESSKDQKHSTRTAIPAGDSCAVFPDGSNAIADPPRECDDGPLGEESPTEGKTASNSTKKLDVDPSGSVVSASAGIAGTRIKKFSKYISKNRDKIVNYKEREKSGLVFTSQLAESTVESLINSRCKGQQHMRWSREGLSPLLQLRAAINSKDDWESKWKMAILNAA